MASNIVKNLKFDLPAGIVVFLVALPLCLGISSASGADSITGVLAGIIGGVVIGLVSGSGLGVSGPAAGLAVIVLTNIENTGFEFFLVAVVLAGIFQIVLGYIKAGIIADFIPSNVIKGMLAAIGLLLIGKQIPHAFGDDKDAEGDMDFIQADGENTFTEIVNAIADPHWGAVIISSISLLILVLWQTKTLKNIKVLAMIPAPLLVVIYGVSMNLFFSSTSPELTLADSHTVNLPVYGEIKDFFTSLIHPDFSVLWQVVDTSKYTGIKPENAQVFTSLGAQYSTLFLMALTMAIVGSLETLLSVEATDKLDPLRRVTPTNRELFAQGLGNCFSGLVGGLPITQVIVRSSANVNAGGKTKTSAIFHGVLLLVAAMFLPMYLNYIPKACLSAILFMTGYKLANPRLLTDMIKLGFRQWGPFVVTVLAILFTNLLVGIIIGLIVSIYFILRDNRNKEPFTVVVLRTGEDDKFDYDVRIKFDNEVNYLNKNLIKLSLHDIPENSRVRIDARDTEFVSHDVIEAMDEFIKAVAPGRNIEISYLEREITQYEIDESVLKGVGS